MNAYFVGVAIGIPLGVFLAGSFLVWTLKKYIDGGGWR